MLRYSVYATDPTRTSQIRTRRAGRGIHALHAVTVPSADMRLVALTVQYLVALTAVHLLRQKEGTALYGTNCSLYVNCA